MNWQEKGHVPEAVPPCFHGHVQEVLARRFSWELAQAGDRIVLTALDAKSNRPGDFCFEILGKRKPPPSQMGWEILIRFVEGSDNFHFYSGEEKVTIPIGSEALIGVCAELIGKTRLTMIDAGGFSAGRDLAFEEVDGLLEGQDRYCIAHKILDGHHLVPEQPLQITKQGLDGLFLVRKIRGIQMALKSGEKIMKLNKDEVINLDSCPNFTLRKNQFPVEKIGEVIYETSLPNVYFRKFWSVSGIDQILLIRLR